MYAVMLCAHYQIADNVLDQTRHSTYVDKLQTMRLTPGPLVLDFLGHVT